MRRSRVECIALAIGAAGYTTAVVAASVHPGPRAWAFHLVGFLSAPVRVAVLTLLVGGTLTLVLDLMRSDAERGESRGQPPAPARPARVRARRVPRAPPGRRGAARRVSAWAFAGLLVPWAALLWLLRCRTLFLGDATVWLANMKQPSPNLYSEPLAARLWWLHGHALRAVGLPVNVGTAGLHSIGCGVLAAVLLGGIATELVPRREDRAIAFLLLLTLGVSQLYFGYIESYPPTAVLILAYLWLGLRLTRGAGRAIIVVGVLSLAIVSHLASAYLIPSYLVLVWREKRSWAARSALVLVIVPAVIGVAVALGYRLTDWGSALRIGAHAVEAEGGAHVLAKPYGALSLDHAYDLLNAVFLVLPVPALALLARAAGWWRRRTEGPGGSAANGAASPPSARASAPAPFLALAALAGVLVAASLVLSVAPAQDWDLTSILLLPLAVLAVQVACSTPHALVRGRRGAAAALLGAGALLSYVGVNANEAAATRRFVTLIGPGARITPYARAYGNELLAAYYDRRGDYENALTHARRAHDAEPDNPRYWVKFGAALYRLRRYDEALASFREAIRRGPSRPDARYDLGNALMMLGRHEEAVAAFRDAIRLAEPRADYEYEYNLGMALYLAGKADSARVVWTAVARRWPGSDASLAILTRLFGPAAAESAQAGRVP